VTHCVQPSVSTVHSWTVEFAPHCMAPLVHASVQGGPASISPSKPEVELPDPEPLAPLARELEPASDSIPELETLPLPEPDMLPLPEPEMLPVPDPDVLPLVEEPVLAPLTPLAASREWSLMPKTESQLRREMTPRKRRTRARITRCLSLAQRPGQSPIGCLSRHLEP
jgi:hypothetical protein